MNKRLGFMLAANVVVLVACSNRADELRIYESEWKPPTGCEKIAETNPALASRMREAARTVFLESEPRPEYIEFKGPYRCDDKVFAWARGMPFFLGRELFLEKQDDSDEISIARGM